MNKNSLGYLLFAIGLLSSCLSHDTFNPKAQFKSDTISIRKYVNWYDPTAKEAEGVWYAIDNVGLGIYPVLSDSVKIAFSAWEIISSESGTVFTIEKRDTSSSLTKLLSTAISGLQIGLPRFTTSSTGRIYVPSGLAYGTTGNDSIRPNRNLLFKIKLISTKGNRFTSDTTALKSFITSIADSLLQNKISVTKDPNGIKYSYDTLYGNPNSNPELYPTLSSTIDLTYTGKVLNADTLFANVPNTVSINLSAQNDERVITAWKIILPKISQGSNVTIYVPSGYGYGSAFMPKGIPANSNLIYQIKLISVH